MDDKPKVAICQAKIIPGGRLQVILEIVQILNDNGIVPTIITSHLSFHPKDITSKYDRAVQVNYHFLPRLIKLPQDFAVVLFNAMLKYYASQYDLLINSSNSLIFLPEEKKIITYMHFPRKRRIMTDAMDIHHPEIPMPRWSFERFQRAVLRQVYRLSRAHSNHMIVCNSKFTRSAVKQEYNVPYDMLVVYPPVRIGKFSNRSQERARAIVTVGRFGPEKRQLEQLKLAQQLPEIQIHIVGFVSNPSYYDDCKLYAEEHTLTNVHLHPGASFEEMVELLQDSKFFLHTLINEPFGITTVQAIAAGCLPIVHDSGGQREIVIDPDLRYNRLDEVPDIIARLEALDRISVDSLRDRLQKHIELNFDTSNFHAKMKTIMAPYLSIKSPKQDQTSTVHN